MLGGVSDGREGVLLVERHHRQGLLDPQSGESGGGVRAPQLLHHLTQLPSYLGYIVINELSRINELSGI